jgi:tetratricopeptide (TPR) repeat protein
MQTGSSAEKQGRWDDAIKAYTEALRLVPNDAKATQSLKNVEYQQHLSEGQKAQKAKRFNDAVREYEAALKAKPNDPVATDALKRAKAGKQ